MSAECARWADLSDLDAIGEPLADADRAFLAAHGAECAACARESAVYEELGALVHAAAPRVALAPAPAPAPVPRAPQPLALRRSRARSFALGALGVAAAAAIAIFARIALAPSPLAVTPPPVATPAPAPAPAPAPPMGLVPGSELATADGTTCVKLDPTIRVCLAPHTRLRVVGGATKERLLALDAGKVTAELDPQPPGASFSIGTRDATVTAIGTAFSVEVIPERPTVARVMHGVVRVRAASGAARDLVAHMELEVGGAEARPLSRGDEAREMEILSLAPPQPLATATATATTTANATATATTTTNATTTATATELLLRARERRAGGDAAGAAAAYRELAQKYPDSAEAHASLVPLGELELGPLGDADAALRAFDRYLVTGGTLAQEASDGRVRALRARGRTEQELAAIRAFLAAYPDSPQARAMEERRRALTVAP